MPLVPIIRTSVNISSPGVRVCLTFVGGHKDGVLSGEPARRVRCLADGGQWRESGSLCKGGRVGKRRL